MTIFLALTGCANHRLAARNQRKGPLFSAFTSAGHAHSPGRPRFSFELCNWIARDILFHLAPPPAYIDSKLKTPADACRSNSLRSVRSKWRFPFASVIFLFLKRCRAESSPV